MRWATSMAWRAGFVEIGPVARAYAGHQCAAECAAFFRGQHFDGLAVDAGLNLAPERAARAAAAEANGADRNAQFGEEREGVLSE
jgi:hypothetical protein